MSKKKKKRRGGVDLKGRCYLGGRKKKRVSDWQKVAC